MGALSPGQVGQKAPARRIGAALSRHFAQVLFLSRGQKSRLLAVSLVSRTRHTVCFIVQGILQTRNIEPSNVPISDARPLALKAGSGVGEPTELPSEGRRSFSGYGNHRKMPV